MKLFPIYQVDVIRDNGKKEQGLFEDQIKAIAMAGFWIYEDDVIEVNIRGRLKRKEEN